MDEDKCAQICRLLESGLSLRKAAKECGVSPMTVLDWTEADAHFGVQYTRARQIGYKLLADEILEISDDTSDDYIETEHGPKPNPEVIARSKLRVDSRKWMLSKMLPKVYGDKLDLNHSGGVTFSQIEAVIVDPKG